MNLTVFFNIIYDSRYAISANFYFLYSFHKKFSVNNPIRTLKRWRLYGNHIHLEQYNHGHWAHTQAMARGLTRATSSTFLATSFLKITPPIWKNPSVSLSVPWTQFLCKCSLAHHHHQHQHQHQHPIDMSKYKEAFSMQMAMAGLKPHHRIGLFLSLFFSVLFMKKNIGIERETKSRKFYIVFTN